MNLNKKNLMILGLAGGIMIFFIGIASYFVLGPSTDDYLLPQQISAVIKLVGMGVVCICMIIGGFFIDKLEKDTKTLLLLFGLILLLINIFILSYSKYY